MKTFGFPYTDCDTSRRQAITRLLSSLALPATSMLAGSPLSTQAQSMSSSSATGQAGGMPSPVIRQFTGKAFHADHGRLFYNEVHRQTWVGDRWISGSIRYLSPEGTLLAEKTLDFSQDRFIPLSRTVFQVNGDEELITRVEADSVTMQTVRGGQRKSREVKRAPAMAADSGFHSFIQAHLRELAAGRTVPLAFGVISQFTTFRFRIRPAEDQRAAAAYRQALVLVAEPDSLLRMIADPLTLVYDLRTRDLLEYQGMTIVDDPQTGKPPKVRIVYEFPAS